MRAFLLAAFAYCILGLAHAEPIDPVALAKNESSDLSALSQKQLYAVADEDAIQFSKTQPLGDDITYLYRIGESHALKHHLRGEPQSLYTRYFADAGATLNGTGKRRFDLPVLHVWTIRDRKVKRFVNFTDTANVAGTYTRN